MNIRTLVRCAVVAGAMALLNTSQAQETFNPTLEERIIKPLREELVRQEKIWAQADKVAQEFDIFIEKFTLGTTSEKSRELLQKNRDELYQKLIKFKELLDVKYVPLEAFNRPMTLPGEKYLVVGAHNFDVPGIDPSQMTCALENQAKFRIYVYLKDYFHPQVATTYAFVAYGVKDNIKEKTLVSEKGYYFAVEKSAFDDTARAYSNSYKDIAGWYFFNKIIPGLGFDEDFQRLDKNIEYFTSDLDKVCAHPQDGGISFGEWRRGAVPEKPKCAICGAILSADRTCPNAANHGVVQPPPSPENQLVKYLKEYGPWALIALVVIIALLALLSKKQQPMSPPPPPPPPQACGKCGTPLVGGKCPKCDKPQYGECPVCHTPLNERGICPECTSIVGKPVSFHNFDEDATRVPAAFDLEILAPAKWAGRYADRLPAKFEMGRYSAKNLPAPGTPFCALNLEGHPDASSCSRRYLRFSMTPDKDGFNVDLLADNYCKVAGTSLRKGENAVAKVGDEIEISPDWRFKVVPRK